MPNSAVSAPQYEPALPFDLFEIPNGSNDLQDAAKDRGAGECDPQDGRGQLIKTPRLSHSRTLGTGGHISEISGLIP